MIESGNPRLKGGEDVKHAPGKSSNIVRRMQFMDIDLALWELSSTTKDLARQDTNEHRCRYYGEARGAIKTLQLLKLIDSATSNQLKMQVWKAHEQAIEQCLAAGHSIDPRDLRRHETQPLRLGFPVEGN